MAKPNFVIVQSYDESRKFLIDGVEVGSVNYDAHGWSGIEVAQEIFTKTAAILGATVNTTYADDE